MFYKKGVLRNFVKFTGRHLCQSLYFNKVAATLLATSFFNKATLLKKRLWCRSFPMNFAKFLRTPSLTEPLQWLLLTPAQMFICNFSESLKNTTGDYFLFFRSLPENISRYYTNRIK